MRRDALLLGLVALAGGARAQEIDWTRPPPLAAERSFHPPHATRLPLASGGALLVIERHDLPLVTTVLVFPGAGAAADPPGSEGLAGFTADLLDEGAGGLGARELAEKIEVLGSTVETWAEKDAAFLQLSALAPRFAQSLTLAATVVTAPTFDEAEARRLHEDRMTAIRLRRDEPGTVAQLIFEHAVYGDGAYGHPPLGSAAGLGRVGLADARAFYRQRYAAAGMIAVVAGDIAADEAKRQLNRALGAWRTPDAAAAPGRPVAAPSAAAARLLVVNRPGAEQSNVIVGGPGLRRSDERTYAFEVLVNLLGGTFTSRLSHRLREELGYTYGVSADATYLREAGTLAIESALFTPRTGAGLTEVARIVAAVARAPVPEAELEAAKRNLARSLPRHFDSNFGVADAFAGVALTGLPDDWFDGYVAKIEAIGAAEVQRVAADILARRSLVTVVVGAAAKIGRDLRKLGLGAPKMYDPDGEPQ